jgi:outer membrane protein assembly factor BamB
MTRRRQLLAALGAGTTGLLAGCNAIRGVIGGGSGSVSSTETWRAPEGTGEATGLSASGGPGPDASEEAVAQFRDGLQVRDHTSPLVGEDGIYEVTGREAPYEDQPPVFRLYAHAHSREDGTERWRTTVVETEGDDESFGPANVASALGPERLYAFRTGGAGRTTVSVTALSREDGSREWSKQFDQSLLLGQPIVHDGTLYLPLERGLLAVDAESGEVRWNREVAVRQRHPVVGEGAVAIYNTGLDGTYDAEGQLTVFDADDGGERWSESLPGARVGFGPVPTIADGTVYLIEGETIFLAPEIVAELPPRKVHARSLGDGSEEWTHTYETDAMQEAVAAGGTSFVTVTDDHLYFALVFGTPQQIVGPQGDPAEIERLEGQIYDGPNVFALDRSDGSVAWEAQPGDYAQVFFPLVADDEHLYVRRGSRGSDDVEIHVLDRESGDEVGSFGPFSGPGPIGVADGDLYVHNQDRVRIFR